MGHSFFGEYSSFGREVCSSVIHRGHNVNSFETEQERCIVLSIAIEESLSATLITLIFLPLIFGCCTGIKGRVETCYRMGQIFRKLYSKRSVGKRRSPKGSLWYGS